LDLRRRAIGAVVVCTNSCTNLDAISRSEIRSSSDDQ
jgi:hypothetical protein